MSVHQEILTDQYRNNRMIQKDHEIQQNEDNEQGQEYLPNSYEMDDKPQHDEEPIITTNYKYNKESILSYDSINVSFILLQFYTQNSIFIIIIIYVKVALFHLFGWSNIITFYTLCLLISLLSSPSNATFPPSFEY